MTGAKPHRRPGLPPARGLAVAVALALVVWGVALGAWLATAATVGLIAVLVRPSPLGRQIGAALALFVLVVGTAEVLWVVDGLGSRAREGELGLRDKVAVYGFNVAFGLAAVPAGFAEFGLETLALGVPFSNAGSCPASHRSAYGEALPVAGDARRWRVVSAMPLRSPRIRRSLAGWARSLPPPRPGSTASRGPERIPPWPAAAYVSPDSANRVATALNTLRTRLSAAAHVDEGRWRMDVTVDLPVAYPERGALQFGPFTLEEGLFHDAQPLLQPYCLEYTFSVWADDPRLEDPVPTRGPFERLSTATIRALGFGSSW